MMTPGARMLAERAAAEAVHAAIARQRARRRHEIGQLVALAELALDEPDYTADVHEIARSTLARVVNMLAPGQREAVFWRLCQPT